MSDRYGRRGTFKTTKSSLINPNPREIKARNDAMWEGTNVKVEHSGVWGRYHDMRENAKKLRGKPLDQLKALFSTKTGTYKEE